MRLGGWQRIGIVLSVIFMIGSLYHRGAQQERRISLYSEWAYQTKTDCIARARASVPPPPAGFILDTELQCISEYEEGIKQNRASWGPVSMDWVYNQMAIVFAFWIVGYLLIFLLRWILRGFKKP